MIRARIALMAGLTLGLLASAGWQWGLTQWPPPPAGPNDSRGVLFHVLLAFTALIYLACAAFVIRTTLRSRPAAALPR